MGRLFNRLSLSGYQQVISLDQNDWAQADTILADADLVLVCVPINKTLETIEHLQPFLTEKMILADLTSVKAQPLQKMLQVHQGAVVGLHPMFIQIRQVWQSKWWFAVTGEKRKICVVVRTD